MTSKEIIKNKLANEQDSYQHYTMVDYDKTKAFWCKCEIEKLEQVLKDLDRLETLEYDLDSEKYHLSNENQSLKNRVEDLEICFKVMVKENEKLKKTIKLLKTKIDLHTRKEEGELKNWWTGETLDESYKDYHVWANKCGVQISEEEYKLLKEVLEDEK